MRLEIKGEIYEFKFGMKFLRTVNKNYSVDARAKEIGMNSGLDVISMNFMKNDPEMLVDVLKIANDTENPKVSVEKLENYVDENGIDDLYNEVLETLKESPSLGTAWKKATNQLEAEVRNQMNKEED